MKKHQFILDLESINKTYKYPDTHRRAWTERIDKATPSFQKSIYDIQRTMISNIYENQRKECLDSLKNEKEAFLMLCNNDMSLVEFQAIIDCEGQSRQSFLKSALSDGKETPREVCNTHSQFQENIEMNSKGFAQPNIEGVSPISMAFDSIENETFTYELPTTLTQTPKPDQRNTQECNKLVKENIIAKKYGQPITSMNKNQEQRFLQSQCRESEDKENIHEFVDHKQLPQFDSEFQFSLSCKEMDIEVHSTNQKRFHEVSCIINELVMSVL